MKISPIAEVEIKITELAQQSNEILDQFDYKFAAKEFFNSISDELLYDFMVGLNKLLENEILKSEKSLEKRVIKFKTKEQQKRDNITQLIIQNTKSF